MNNKKNIFLISVLAMLLVAFFSCKVKKSQPLEEVPETAAFFTLVLSKDTIRHKTKAELKNITVVNTKIRYIIDEAKAKDPNFLKIEIVYKNNKIINACTEHPLYKRVDLFSESGEIESKLISLTQGEVTFRVPYFEQYKKITILETASQKENKPIILKNEK